MGYERAVGDKAVAILHVHPGRPQEGVIRGRGGSRAVHRLPAVIDGVPRAVGAPSVPSSVSRNDAS